MEVILAKTAGFCFGVERAVTKAFSLAETNPEVLSYGEIIHNETVVKELENKGMHMVNSIDTLHIGQSVLIRAHGVGRGVMEKLYAAGVHIYDATCPYVLKIHRLVEQESAGGKRVIIVGDPGHPEIQGICGWCGEIPDIISGPEEARSIADDGRETVVVVQTTYSLSKWRTVQEILKSRLAFIDIRNTICSATEERQLEAEQIAACVDLMIVIGSAKSSNTRKLYEVCSKFCKKTIMVETPGDLPPVEEYIQKIGITAGASTPDRIIKEVFCKMSELNKDMEMSFSEAFENSLKTVQSGEIVKGRIIGFTSNEVYVDLGYKSDGVVALEEFTEDPEFKVNVTLKAGDEIEVFVVRVNDGEGNIVLSKKRVDAIKGFNELEGSYEEKTPIKVRVIEAVKGGLVATVNGVRVFIPASQVSDRFVKDLTEFVKQTLTVQIIEFNKQKRKIVASARILLEEDRKTKTEAFWATAEIGKTFVGTVKNLMDFGAFVDLGGVDGLVHVSELSWGKIKHPSEVVKVGDRLEVRIIEMDREKNRISLGFRKAEDNPWVKAEQKYQVGEVVTGTVARMVPFGAFVALEDGIDGLVHISQISNVRIAKPEDVLAVGMKVDARVVEFNIEAKKIGLSIKEVSPIDPEGEEETEIAE